jgi:plastocyanin
VIRRNLLVVAVFQHRPFPFPERSDPVKKLLALTAAGAAAAALAMPALASGPATVKVGDDFFVRKGSPPTVTVKSGQKIKFVWSGKHRHNVYQVGGPIDGKHFHIDARTKGTVTRTFHKRGTYPLLCTYHSNMKMTLKVK